MLHLIVCHHGLWGTAKHMDWLCDKVKDSAIEVVHSNPHDDTTSTAHCNYSELNEHKPINSTCIPVEIYNCDLNQGTLSYAGVDVCGGRVTVSEIKLFKDLNS